MAFKSAESRHGVPRSVLAQSLTGEGAHLPAPLTHLVNTTPFAFSFLSLQTAGESRLRSLRRAEERPRFQRHCLGLTVFDASVTSRTNHPGFRFTKIV